MGRGPVALAAMYLAAVSALAAPVRPRDLPPELAVATARAAKDDFRGVLAALSAVDLARLEPRHAALAHQMLANARISTGDPDGALREADMAEPLATRSQAYDILVRLEAIRASVWTQRGLTERALRHGEKALAWSEASGDGRLTATALVRLAEAHKGLGNWTRVLDYTRRAMEADASPSDLARMNYHVELGTAYFEFHERDSAEKEFLEVLAIARRIGARNMAALANFELGLLAWTFDRDLEKARSRYLGALQDATAAGTPHHAVNAVNEMGNLYRESGDPARAFEHYQRALALERSHGAARVAPYLMKNSGQVLRRLGREEEAERWLEEALALADRLGVKRIQWQARMELALLYRKSDPARATRYFGDTLDVIEAEHSNVLLDDLRAGSLAVSLSFYDPYDLYIAFLLDQGRPADAFVVGERARARAFLATLSAVREEVAPAVPPEYLREEADVLRRISEQQAELRSGTPAEPRRRELLASIQREEDRLTALRVRLATERPHLAQARYPRLWTVEALQAEMLRPREALAVFFLGREGSVCWVVTRDGLQTIRLPRRTEIEPVIRASVDSLRAPGADARGPARRLYDVLAGPVLAHVPEGWRLLVVPHGPLHHVPLETALDPAGRYLIERNAVSYAPSASSLAYLRTLPVATTRGDEVLLAVGDPELGSSGPAAERAVDPALVALLKPLAQSAEELRRIGSVFDGVTHVLARDRANEEELARVDGRTVRVLHFATHGLLDDRRPDRSALALTARPPEHDGLLQTREVFRLRLKARLVTLSACQTALGKELTGEGLVGLARAFFFAGADAVMASLWSVDDASTTRWMGDFYTRLREGDTIDEAARAAKLGFIRAGGDLAHPYYWAPFIVTGNAAVGAGLPGASWPSGAAWAAAAAGAVATALYLTVRVRRRRRAARS